MKLSCGAGGVGVMDLSMGRAGDGSIGSTGSGTGGTLVSGGRDLFNGTRESSMAMASGIS